MKTDTIRHFNRYYAPLSINFGFNHILERRNKLGFEYFIRPLSLDRFIENEIIENIYHVKVKENDIVIDGGSHIGLFSLYCASKGAKVYSFEPDKENLQLQNDNIKMNSWMKINVIPSALWTYTGQVKFYQTRNKGNNSIKPFYKLWNKESIISCIDINSELPCDILKLDIEGAEYDLLAHTNINQIKKQITIEYHKHIDDWEHKLMDISWRLMNNGFKFEHKKEFGFNGVVSFVR